MPTVGRKYPTGKVGAFFSRFWLFSFVYTTFLFAAIITQ